jgi:tRNA modification GTPase
MHMITTPEASTIAAIATAPGAAGLAVVRVSGPLALAVSDRVFRGSRPLAAAVTHSLHHGWLFAADSEQRVDEVVAAVFRAPRSYTCEDVVELSCHGGRISAERVLAALLEAGARLARPGEFTLRAFLNGRLDLAAAEAVADVIRAETERAHDLALAQLAGSLSRALAAVAERLTDALAEVEARVDFAEDVGGVEVPAHVAGGIAETEAALARLLEGAEFARAMREGVHVPLVGRPNVGKSSLFNALLGEERAIVAAEPGTTRDRVSERIEIAGVPVTLSDTAGLRETRHAIEAEGVTRTNTALDESRCLIWVLDGSSPLEPADRALAERLAGRRVVVAINKRDRPAAWQHAEAGRLLADDSARRVVEVSATSGLGLERLSVALAEMLETPSSSAAEGGGIAAVAPAVSNPRHIEALGRARDALARAREAASGGLAGELVSMELRESLMAIGEVTGTTVDADLLDRIFSRFCIGK